MSAYTNALKSVLSGKLRAVRINRGISQDSMSELLHIVPRSYIELEHGRSLCSTRVLVFLLLMCDEDSVLALLSEIRSVFSALSTHDDAVA